MSNRIDEMRLELKLNRQLETSKILILLLVAGFIGGSISTIIDPTKSETHVIEISVILIVSVSLISIVYFHQFRPRRIVNDWFYFAFAVMIYFTVVVLNWSNPSITVSFWMLSLLIVIVATLNKLILIGFMTIHTIFNILLVLILPKYTMYFTFANYIEILTNSIIILYGGYRIVCLYNQYQSNLVSEFNEIILQKDEIQALNEEHIAAEEELHSQYDEILALNRIMEGINERTDAILSVSNDAIIDYTIEDKSYFISEKANKNFGHLDSFQRDPIKAISKRLESTEAIKFLKLYEYVCMNIDISREVELELSEEINGIKNINVIILNYFSHHTHSTHVITAMQNISEKKKQEYTIYKLAYIDKITGLPNGESFKNNIQGIISQESKFYHIQVRITNYSLLRNVYGIECSYQILNRMKQLLEELPIRITYLSYIDIATYGGVVSNETNMNEWFNESNYSIEFDYEEIVLHIEYTIGITEFDGTQNSDTLIRQGQIALDKGDDLKSGLYIYNSMCEEDLQQAVQMVQHLKNALLKDEIYVVFQPIVNSENNSVCAFEALCRWNSKYFGHVSPAEFIPLAEKKGVIVSIEDYVIKQACHFIKKRNVNGYNCTVSINISSYQLHDKQFVERIVKLVKEEGVLPSKIGLEMTEGTAVNDFEVVKKSLKELKNEGFKIYLDDFGTGYSSLNYLYVLPIDVLKVDKSFVDEIKIDNRKQLILEEIIDLSAKLEIKCIVEGVETFEQLQLVKDTGANLIQGYYYSKPVLEEEAVEFNTNIEIS